MILPFWWTHALIAGIALVIGYSVQYMPRVKHPERIEKICENVIERQTGIDVDFKATPTL